MVNRLNYMEINAKATNSLASINKHVSSISNKLRALVDAFSVLIYILNKQGPRGKVSNV